MKTLTLKIKDIQALNIIKEKVIRHQSLTREEEETLYIFLNTLPSTRKLLADKDAFTEEFAVDVIDMKEAKPEIDKWINLFKRLPKNGNKHHPSAYWTAAEEEENYAMIEQNVIIVVKFVPSFVHSKSHEGFQTFELYLKTNGTAQFILRTLEDTENFPHLYNFTGSWRDAYLLTVKTLKEGWPQTTFPKEFEQLLNI